LAIELEQSGLVYDCDEYRQVKNTIHVFLTDLTRASRETTWAFTRVAVDKVYARATILAGVGRTFVDICPHKYIM